jgi:hypothetical protein
MYDRTFKVTTLTFKAFPAIIFIWGIYQLDDDGKMLSSVQVSVNDIRNSLGTLKSEVASMARGTSQNARDIARLQEHE